jgi:hypothetical protein
MAAAGTPAHKRSYGKFTLIPEYGAVGTVIAKTTALLVQNVLLTYIVWSKLVDEIPENVEFGIDLRTGHPIITQPESLERLIECFFVGPIEHWANPTFVM